MSTTILYPHYAAAADGDELRLSLRSLNENLVGDYDLCVIGDIPDWYTGPNIPLRRLTQSQYQHHTGRRFHNRWHGILDVLWKYCAASQCPDVSDEFIVMWDDTFLMKPVDVDYLIAPRYLDEIPNEKFRNNDFWDMMMRTRRRLRKKGLPIHDFATHHPFPMDSRHLAEYCHEFNAFVSPGSTHTQFHNWRRSECDQIDPRNFRYINAERSRAQVESSITARIVNYAIVTPEIESAIRREFPGASPWERANNV